MRLQLTEKKTMRHSCISIIVALVLFSNCERVFSQSNTFPINPPVGIGTQLSTPSGPLNALHIHFDPAHSDTAILRLSEGTGTNSIDFGILGLMQESLGHTDNMFSSLSTGDDLILHQHQDGDIIITNYSVQPLSHGLGTAIRFATTGDTLARPTLLPDKHDLERLTIMGNGNVGIDLPPSITGLDSAKDQLQLGGGSTIPIGELDPLPGLNFYGGNRFEGLPKIGGDFFPVDWRYIGFNYGTNHADSSSTRLFRQGRMSSSVIKFSDFDSGTVELDALPYASSRGLNNFSKATTLNLSGQFGLGLWFMDTTANPYHNLLNVYPPGVLPYGVTRNTNGLSFFHTPLCIGIDTPGNPLPDFTNFSGVHPAYGDGLTWMLVVNGAELAKEIFVLDSTWADYVFDPGYKLPPISEVENFTKENHHLPNIPSAKQMAKTGVPVGRTEEALTKQVEEEMLYIEQLNHKIEGLEADVNELKGGKEK
jgi:hypothetical protein